MRSLAIGAVGRVKYFVPPSSPRSQGGLVEQVTVGSLRIVNYLDWLNWTVPTLHLLNDLLGSRYRRFLLFLDALEFQLEFIVLCSFSRMLSTR